MAFSLTANQQQQILVHAESTYPEECCGILLGRIDRQSDPIHKTLVEVIPVANAWNEAVAADLQAADLISASRHSANAARRDRYWIDPQDLLQAQRQARSQNLQIIGIYHSHPDHPAVPSESDRRMAWAEYVYLIASVQQGKAESLLGWSLDEQHQFQSEEIQIREGDRSNDAGFD